MDDAARKVANCMEDDSGETRQEIINEVAFALVDEVDEYFDTYHDGKLELRLLDMILNLVAASMVNQYEFDAKRWGKVPPRRRIIKQRPLPLGSGLISDSSPHSARVGGQPIRMIGLNENRPSSQMQG
jgi:hypothetical protein